MPYAESHLVQTLLSRPEDYLRNPIDFRTFTCFLRGSWTMSTQVPENEQVFVCFEGKYHADQTELGGRFYRQMSELVQTQPGFISQTAFVSVDDDLQRLLYVRFEDEEHLHKWSNNHAHRGVQAKGRANVFADYRLRVGKEALPDQLEFSNSGTASASKYLLLWQYPKSTKNTDNDQDTSYSALEVDVPSVIWQRVVDTATYHNNTHILRISAWPSENLGRRVEAAIPRIEGDDLRLIRIERDYGRFRRDEAPVHADATQRAAATDET